MPFRTSSINATMPLSYNADDDEPPKKYSTHPPPPLSLSSLPDDIVFRCLALVPRSYHLSFSWVSKHLIKIPWTRHERQFDAAVGVIDGKKIHVIGGGGFPEESFHEEIQVEVFDPKSETWELAGMENMRKTSRCGALVEGKLYMVEYEETNVYNPRECEGERIVHMVSQRLEKGGRKDTLNDTVDCVCVVDDVLSAFVRWKKGYIK
uniref:F-box domain-containing protein n=1 Tax=Brassica oleracea TaxID=3712 RepID=A0A3P6FWK8_BRAOL|nr:unnamed protein product [Brassica oleracea]